MVKICPICRQTFPSKAALAQHMATHTGGGAGRRRRGRPTSANVTTLAQEEYWGETEAGKAKNFTFHPGSSGLTRLDTMASVHEQYRVTSLTVRFTPQVGSNMAGMFFAGWCRDPSKAPATDTKIAGLTPHCACAVWQSTSLTIRANDLMRQNWFLTRAEDAAETTAGCVATISTGSQTAKMAVWCRYVVQFSGPTSRDADDFLYRYAQGRWYDEKSNVVTEMPAADGPYSVDLEVTEGPAVLTQAWQSLSTLFANAREVHRIVSTALSFGRWVAEVTGGQLPLLPTGTVATLHAHPDPFHLRARYRSAEWRGPGAEGGSCTSSGCA